MYRSFSVHLTAVCSIDLQQKQEKPAKVKPRSLDNTRARQASARLEEIDSKTWCTRFTNRILKDEWKQGRFEEGRSIRRVRNTPCAGRWSLCVSRQATSYSTADRRFIKGTGWTAACFFFLSCAAACPACPALQCTNAGILRLNRVDRLHWRQCCLTILNHDRQGLCLEF